MINAENFEEANMLVEMEIRHLLYFITVCHKLMLLKYKNKKIQNNENHIRNRLYKDFLTSTKLKDQFNLFPCRFECECAEINDSYEEVGYTDLKVLTSASFLEEEAYYIFECKRLDGSQRLSQEYIKNGIHRFSKQDKYPSYCQVNAMIGFLINNLQETKAVEKINNILIKNEDGKSENLVEDEFSKNIYISRHPKSENIQIQLFHLMLEYSSIISQKKAL